MSAVQMTLFIRMKCTADVSITVYSLNIVTINIDPFLSIGKQHFYIHCLNVFVRSLSVLHS